VALGEEALMDRPLPLTATKPDGLTIFIVLPDPSIRPTLALTGKKSIIPLLGVIIISGMYFLHGFLY
jgi:hypothetical protein